ncbi:hypothetical protein Hanom_Chr05g00398561 [Helianthus anomalus]
MNRSSSSGTVCGFRGTFKFRSGQKLYWARVTWFMLFRFRVGDSTRFRFGPSQVRFMLNI